MSATGSRATRAQPLRRRDPVSRSAEATGAVLAMSLVALGLIMQALLPTAPQVVLGLFGGCIAVGIALDVYARGLGAWSARHDPVLAVIVAVIGSPAVLWHAVARREGRLAPEPGALAGLLVPACVVIVLWAQANA